MTASMRQQPATTTRQEFAERLLKGSVKKSYAPVVDIDWDAPLDPDKFFLPPRSVSLYGTPMWDEMTREQQIELSRQELVNTLSAGIWFENILNQALLRKVMHQDPTARSTHYELTELGDETRHMVMFGKAIEHLGAKPVQPRRYHRMIINTLPFAFVGSVLWVAALIGEEIFDSLQRQMMDDDELQPMVQRLMRIHVTEEAGTSSSPATACASGRRRWAASPGCTCAASTASAGTSSVSCSPTGCRTTASDSTPTARAASPAPARIATRCRSAASPRWPRSSKRSA